MLNAKIIFENGISLKVHIMIHTYNMFAVAFTFGCSSARCEASFSTLNRIMCPQRVGMHFEREAALTLLSFERNHLENIPNDEILRMFSSTKNRKLQIY